MNVNSIVMIEMHKMILPIMRMKGKNWITKVALIVKYLPPPGKNVPVINFVPEQQYRKKYPFFWKLYDDIK